MAVLGPGGTLLYRISPANGGLTLALPERAEYVARIHKAIETARTWGRFRRLMPADALEDLMRDREEDGEPRPADADPFSAECIPAYLDGDYPAWLQQEMEEVVPDVVLKEFGRREVTSLNGAYWHIDPSHLTGLISRLQGMGYTSKDGEQIGLWY